MKTTINSITSSEFSRFEDVLDELEPKLYSISNRFKKKTSFIDTTDLFQEMTLYLFKRWRNGKIEGYTRSYILQSCWFYISNYLRTKSDKSETFSIDAECNNSDMCLADILPDDSELISETVNFNITISNIMEKDLTEREKEVFYLTLKGFTLREIGKLLNISFVRVSKIQNNIKKKVKDLAYVL